MKKKIAWITDSVSCILPEVAKQNDINVIPLSIIFEDNSYKDGELSSSDFYSLLKSASKAPTTSQPSIGEFVELYSKLKEDYEMGIAVHVTSKVSGTYNTSITAAEIAGFPMIHIDSKIGAKPVELMMLDAIHLSEEGKTVEEINQHLQELTSSVKGLALVGSLEQLHKGGRVSGLGFLTGNLLQIKPILHFDDGALVPLEKVRTAKKAEKRLLEIFQESSKKVYGISIAHANAYDKAIEYKNAILGTYPNQKVDICELSPVITAHVGEGTVALFWFEK